MSSNASRTRDIWIRKETKRASGRNGTSGFNSWWRKDIWYPIQLRPKPSLRQSTGWVIVSLKMEYVGRKGRIEVKSHLWPSGPNPGYDWPKNCVTIELKTYSIQVVIRSSR